MHPDFTYRQLRAATTEGVLAQAHALAAEVRELDWDEHSVWGELGNYGPGELMLHHAARPLAGECPCRRRKSGLCVHVTAVALAYLGDTDELRQALTRLPHTDLVALLCELADRSEQARRAIQVRIKRASA